MTLDKIKIEFTILNEKLRNIKYKPKYMTSHSSGVDLISSSEKVIIIKPMEIMLVPTGIAVSIPPGFEAQIRPRSGLALKKGISIPNSPGTIDADYRGEIKVILINLGKEEFIINFGDRIAQMVFASVVKADWQLVDKLDSSERGDGGFGHTGI